MQKSSITFSRTLTIAILFVVCLFECRAQQTAPQPEEEKTGTITGKVFNDAGQPLAGATVSIRSAGITRYVNRSAQTNAEGSFQVSGLDSGLYYVAAFSPAYITTPTDPDEPPRTYRVGESVRLELVRGGVLTGTVANSNGEPVIGVRIRALMMKDAAGKDLKGRFVGGDRQTDDRGIYRMFGLPPGTYVVFAGGSSGPQYGNVNATDFDAPTYAPSSTRDTATEVQVRSGDETTVDIRYRYEQGHSISGTVRTIATNGVSVTLTQANGPLSPIGNYYQPTNVKSFVFTGIADGDYTLNATEVVSQQTSTPALPELAVSDPLRITVKGGDVTGVELVPKTLGSISGSFALEPGKLTECQNKRKPEFNETMLNLIQNKKDSEIDQLSLIRTVAGASIPDKDGSFVIKNLRPGQYTFNPRFFARYWYLRSISLSGPVQATTRGPAPANRDAAKNWMSLKTGERITGLTISLSEGAASIKGTIEKNEAGLRVYLVPSERDKLDDPFRYFTSEVAGDGTFTLTNLPPGKYWTLVQKAQADLPGSTEKLRQPDAIEARTKIRHAAETGKAELDLKPCQNLIELTLRLN